MKTRNFDKFTEAEAEKAAGGSVEHVVTWLKAEGITAGSTAGYDLYRAIQEAIMQEWRNSREKRTEATDGIKVICVADIPPYEESEEWQNWLKTRRIGCAEYDPQVNVIRLYVYPSGNGYEVDLDRCKTARQFTDWVFHLAGKRWFKDNVPGDFILCLKMAIRERHGKSAAGFFKVHGAA